MPLNIRSLFQLKVEKEKIRWGYSLVVESL